MAQGPPPWCRWACPLLAFATVGASPPRSSMDAEMDRLVAWVREHDGFISEKVSIQSSGRERRVVAIAELDAGETIVRVPAKLHLTQESASRMHPLPREVARLEGHSVHTTPLAAYIVREIERRGAERRDAAVAHIGGTSSRTSGEQLFAPFWDSIHLEKMESMPFFRGEDDLRLVEGSPEHDNLVNHIYWYGRDHARIVSNFFRKCPGNSDPWCVVDIGSFNETAFIAASLYISSRAYGGRNSQHSVVPVAQELNHRTEGLASATWAFDTDEDALVIWAGHRAIQEGDEVTISYGTRSNAELFTTYGFTVAPALERHFSFRAWATKLHELFPWLKLAESVVDVMLVTLELEHGGAAAAVGDEPLQAIPPQFLGLRPFLEGAKVGGVGAADALTKLLNHLLPRYDSDELVRPFLEQLRQNRARRADSWVWWADENPEVSIGELPDGSAPEAFGGRWRSDVVRLKMSEYLTLLSFLEMLRVRRGAMPREEALPQAQRMVEPFSELVQHIEGAPDAECAGGGTNNAASQCSARVVNV